MTKVFVIGTYSVKSVRETSDLLQESVKTAKETQERLKPHWVKEW